jgi:hypothetical protein
MLKLHQVQPPPAIGQTISRDLMPQIRSISDFLQFLKSNGVEYAHGTVPTEALKSTQTEFDDDKIAALMTKADNDAIIVSNDNHVLDGHHRWIADHSTDGHTKACVVNLPILELLRLAKEYTSVSLKEEITRKEFQPMLDSFVSFASDRLGVKSLPNIQYKDDDDGMGSFGGYDPKDNQIVVHTKGRHPMDIFRTVAHEIIHHKQNEDGRIHDVSKEGATGSDIENEANAMAGQIMRHYAKSNPSHFKLTPLSEAVFVVGVPCSGKDRIIRELKESGNYKEADLNSLHKFKTSDQLIVSCSADNVTSIRNANQFLLENDFETSLIFVDIPNNVSKMRNEMRKNRGQRIINENVRFKKYTTAKGNLDALHSIFEGSMQIIDNSLQEKRKLKVKRKVLNQEDRVPTAITGNLPPSGLGPEAMVSGVPGIISGYGSGYSIAYNQYNESVQRWVSNQKTVDRFTEKYGDDAIPKLFETANEINSRMTKKPIAAKPRTLSSLRESFDLDIGLMGTVPQQGKEDSETPANPPKSKRKLNRKSNRGP